MSKTINSNIKARKKEENRLKLAIKKLKVLEKEQRVFIGNITHEFKTPLTVIQSYVDLMKIYDDNQINVINDTRDIGYKGDRIDSIKEYDNVKGFCWIDDNNIIIGKMNTKPLNHVQGLLETEKNKDKIN